MKKRTQTQEGEGKVLPTVRGGAAECKTTHSGPGFLYSFKVKVITSLLLIHILMLTTAHAGSKIHSYGSHLII